jgi:hypothetical protein
LEFNNQFSDKVDKEDALKLTNINENFNLIRDGKKLSVERRTLINKKDTIFFQLSRTTPRNYQFTFSPKNLDSNLVAILEDAYLVKRYPFNFSRLYTYPFSINSDSLSFLSNRFRIVFNTKQLIHYDWGDPFLKAYRINNQILVEWIFANNIGYGKYDIEKSNDSIHFNRVYTFVNKEVNKINNWYSWIDNSPFNGNNFYRIRTVDNIGAFKYSEVVKVEEDKSASGIFLQFNPTITRTINLYFKNLPAGWYKVRLINSIGQTIFNKAINHTAGSSTEKVAPGLKLIPGIYQLEITYPNKEVKFIKIIVS